MKMIFYTNKSASKTERYKKYINLDLTSINLLNIHIFFFFFFFFFWIEYIKYGFKFHIKLYIESNIVLKECIICLS